MAPKKKAEAAASPSKAAPSPKKQKTKAYTHTRESFLEDYAVLRDELVEDKLFPGQPERAKEWTRKMIDYNVPGGKLNRGMAVYDVLAAIRGAAGVPRPDAFRANAVGWCIEWLQAFFLVADDIMDDSKTRRGAPCWYRVPEVGMIACNDYILLEAHIYRMLKAHAGHLPTYGRLLELFHEVTYQTSHGQLLDLITAPAGKADLSTYTLDSYLRIVTYKTAFYTFYLPVACGMVLAGITDDKAYKLAEDICIEMGRYFQIQDDYLDCYGAPEVIGKIGTDIEDAKCCWLVCTALQSATAAQKKVITEHYGRKEASSVAKIKALYKELKMEQRFLDYEAASYKKLSAQIQGQSLLPKPVFTSLLEKIYKRQK